MPSPVKLGSDELPHIDAVLISHNHYDHLDAGTVAYLHRRYGAALAWYTRAAAVVLLSLHACGGMCMVGSVSLAWSLTANHPMRRFVPLGLRKWFAGCGIGHAQELDWWQEAPLGSAGARVTFTPAQVPGPGVGCQGV